MPVIDNAGRKLGYRQAISDLDEDTLQRIAETTGGKFFRAMDLGTAEAAFTPPVAGGRPPRLAKKTETEVSPQVTQSAQSEPVGRPPRLQKRTDATPPAEPTIASTSGGRPPRLEKRSEPTRTEFVSPSPSPEPTPAAPDTVIQQAMSVPWAPTATLQPARDANLSRKRKLRGIRIKVMNEGSDEQ